MRIIMDMVFQAKTCFLLSYYPIHLLAEMRHANAKLVKKIKVM